MARGIILLQHRGGQLMHTVSLRRHLAWLCALLIAALLVPAGPSHAEAIPLRLSLRRQNGADLLGRIAGTFRLSVQTTPKSLAGVTYFLDGEIVGRATSYPFSSEIDTSDFPKGEHELQAVAHFTDGSVVTSAPVSREFRSRNWLLAMRQSMFLYAAVVLGLGILGGLGVRRLLSIHPRLVLLDR
jgi:hypothetical protein